MNLKLLVVVICLSLCLGLTTSIRILQETTAPSKVLNAQIYVQESTLDYFYYKVYTESGQVSVEVLDSQLKNSQLTFSTEETSLVFKTAYNRYIIVEEKNATGNSVEYWVLQIVAIETGFVLESFSVKSRVDDEGFALDDSYNLTSVIEYSKQQSLLYVTLVAMTDHDIYAIDLKNRADTLKTVNWFFYSLTAREKIVGGNSRVLVDATSNQLMVDTQNVRVNNTDPTVFDRVNITEYTSLPIFQGGSTTFNFIGSYFQYVSVSSDGLNMTTFLWEGYQKNVRVQKQASLNSSLIPIKFFSDEQTFFFAIADNEVYATKVKWLEQTKQYEVWGYSLSEYITDENERKIWLQNFKSALLITYFNKRFYVLTKDSFLVYGENELSSKLLTEPVEEGDDLQLVMMTEMKPFLEKDL